MTARTHYASPCNADKTHSLAPPRSAPPDGHGTPGRWKAIDTNAMSAAGAVPAAARGEQGREAAAQGGRAAKIIMVITECKRGASGEGIRRVKSRGSALRHLVPRGEMVLQCSRRPCVWGANPSQGIALSPSAQRGKNKPCKERKKPVNTH